jgi:hypothetical protein
MKAKIICRKGNRFAIDESKLTPHLKKNKDLVGAAVAAVCRDFSENLNKYKQLSAEQKLEILNNNLVSLLQQWGIIKR